MRITTAIAEGVVVLEVSGELDVAVADELREAGVAALTPAAKTLRIDLGGVTFMDSSALGALIAIRNAAGDRHAVIVQNVQQRIRRIFEITGLTDLFEIDRPDPVEAT